jgi:glycosyltransferase involved in cell wall biosynthesis
MKILYLTDRFLPEISAPCFRAMEHARVWIAEGHDVTVVTCAPNSPRGKIFDGYRNKLYQTETMEGVRVIRLWSYMTANVGVVKRTLDYVSFMVSSIAMCWRFPRFDVVVASSPTFFTAVAGYVISVLRRRPWVFLIRDLWPASIRAVGASNSRALDWVERLELFLYRKAHHIVAVGNAIKADLVERGIPPEKIDVVTNGVDPAQFNPSRATFDARPEIGVGPEHFLAGYVGTTGMAHGLETILDAAELCRDDDRIRFLIMGDGARRTELEQAAHRRGIANLVFKDVVPHDRIPAYLASMDLSIIHLRPDPVFRTAIPSKTFECMAMGVPILMGVEGEAAGIVEESGSGVCIPPGDAEAMARETRGLSHSPERLRELGRNGIAAVEARYARPVLALRELSALEAAIEAYRR